MSLGELLPTVVLKSILMNECPYADCVCLMLLVGELDLMEVQIMSFPMVCWQLLPW